MEGECGTIGSGALRRARLGVTMLRKLFFRSRVEFSRNPPYTHGVMVHMISPTKMNKYSRGLGRGGIPRRTLSIQYHSTVGRGRAEVRLLSLPSNGEVRLISSTHK